MIDEDVFAIQRYYPQIYLACHTDHVRASSTKWKLSSHDSSILAHLDLIEATSPRDLQKHLGIVPSSLSAQLSRLVSLGYISNEPSTVDKRKREIRLTEKGRDAMQGTSVLDTSKLHKLLTQLPDTDRKIAVRGLALLARAAGELSGGYTT